MSVLNPFKNPWFSMTSLTGVVEKVDFVPQYLGGLGIFNDDPVRTYDLFVDRSDQGLTLVPTSELGAPPDELDRDQRDVVTLRIPRIAQSFTLHTHELIGLRGFGTEGTFQNYQVEYIKRFDKMRRRNDLTQEYHRLGAVQGLVLDADGTRVIHDSFDVFGVPRPAGIDFPFSDADADIRQVCHNIVRDVVRSSRGAMTGQSRIHSICGDEFYDSLITHPSVSKYYLQWSAAQELKEQGPFEAFTFGKITFHNYRGTDDKSTVSVADTQAKFFPVNADVFTRALGPAEFGDLINQPGREIYAYNLPDTSGRDAWTKGEVYNYPLHFCRRPDLLREGVAT